MVCCCFTSSHFSEFCSVQEKFTHASYIKKDRKTPEFPEAPGARQVEAGDPVIFALTVVWWHLSLVFPLFTGKFQITAGLTNVKRHSDCTFATAQSTDFNCSWAALFKLEAVWPAEGVKQQLSRSWLHFRNRTEEDKMETRQNLWFMEKVRIVLWNLSLNYIHVCVLMYVVAYYECLSYSHGQEPESLRSRSEVGKLWFAGQIQSTASCLYGPQAKNEWLFIFKYFAKNQKKNISWIIQYFTCTNHVKFKF